MDAKAYLSKIAKLKRRIDIKRKDLDEYRALKSCVSGVSYGERVQTSPTNDQMPSVIVKIIEKEQEINELISKYVDCREKIIKEIENCHYLNDNEYSVLMYRYVQCQTQIQTAEVMNYSERRIQDIEYKALEKFSRFCKLSV